MKLQIDFRALVTSRKVPVSELAAVTLAFAITFMPVGNVRLPVCDRAVGTEIDLSAVGNWLRDFRDHP